MIAALAAFLAVTAGQPASSCVVIYDVAANTYWRSDAKACAMRLSPASTFKIPHALESAIQNSVLWFFQRTAVKVGSARMRSYLERFGYGNADTSGSANEFWINGRLRISADEQVEFLRRFYARDLGIAAAYQDVVFRALVEPPGGVQNATGVHTLSTSWRKGDTLSAKTGAGMALTDPQVRVSWLVGELSAGGKKYIFASNTVRRGTLDPVEAARQAFNVFRERRLID